MRNRNLIPKPKPFIGQELFLVRRNRNVVSSTAKVLVKAVGRKYFTVGSDARATGLDREFHIDSWTEKSEYTSDYTLYENEAQFVSEERTEELSARIRKDFEWSSQKPITLDQLERINAILDEGSDASSP